MLEVVMSDGQKIYLPLQQVRIIQRNEDGELVICFEDSNGQSQWRVIKHASVVSGSKKMT